MLFLDSRFYELLHRCYTFDYFFFQTFLFISESHPVDIAQKEMSSLSAENNESYNSAQDAPFGCCSGPVKFNFKHFLFYSAKSEND